MLNPVQHSRWVLHQYLLQLISSTLKMKVFQTVCLLLLVCGTIYAQDDEIVDNILDDDSLTFPPPTDPPCGCSTPAPPPTCPCPPCVNGNCTPNMCNQAVHVPYPGDCTKFCKCDHIGAIAFDCPSGLHFNAALQVCDWPQAAGCTVDNTYNGACESMRPF